MSRRRKAARSPKRTAERVKVFISHATADRVRAQRLGRLLRQHGIDYWFSREHLVHGHSWYKGIGEALDSCSWLAIVGTRAAIRNKWVRDEVTYALVERRYRNRVVPLLFENCKLHKLAWSLLSIQYLDFRQGWHPAVDTLLARLGARKVRPAVRRGNR
jgi:hypothetical protein